VAKGHVNLRKQIIGMIEHRACTVLQVDRSTIRYHSIRPDDADVRVAIKAVAAERCRFGYRRIHVMLAKQLKPDLVLADVQLAANSSGIDAVSDLGALSPIEPVFVTAFAQRVSASIDASPLFIISKPFAPDLIATTLMQAAMQHRLNQTAPRMG